MATAETGRVLQSEGSGNDKQGNVEKIIEVGGRGLARFTKAVTGALDQIGPALQEASADFRSTTQESAARRNALEEKSTARARARKYEAAEAAKKEQEQALKEAANTLLNSGAVSSEDVRAHCTLHKLEVPKTNTQAFFELVVEISQGQETGRAHAKPGRGGVSRRQFLTAAAAAGAAVVLDVTTGGGVQRAVEGAVKGFTGGQTGGEGKVAKPVTPAAPTATAAKPAASDAAAAGKEAVTASPTVTKGIVTKGTEGATATPTAKAPATARAEIKGSPTASATQKPAVAEKTPASAGKTATPAAKTPEAAKPTATAKAAITPTPTEGVRPVLEPEVKTMSLADRPYYREKYVEPIIEYWRKKVFEIAATAQIDPHLLMAVVMASSAGNPSLVREIRDPEGRLCSNLVGLTQLEPLTLQSIAKADKVDITYDMTELLSPEKNLATFTTLYRYLNKANVKNGYKNGDIPKIIDQIFGGCDPDLVNYILAMYYDTDNKANIALYERWIDERGQKMVFEALDALKIPY